MSRPVSRQGHAMHLSELGPKSIILDSLTLWVIINVIGLFWLAACHSFLRSFFSLKLMMITHLMSINYSTPGFSLTVGALHTFCHPGWCTLH